MKAATFDSNGCESYTYYETDLENLNNFLSEIILPLKFMFIFVKFEI